jgi:hypothetical protein
MTRLKLKPIVFVVALYLPTTTVAFAQVLETVGSRALGMGGAFVAVASDSSATWWNPAGLAAGPFLDLALARGMTEQVGGLPARRDTATGFSLGTPPVGFSYYRLRITDLQPLDHIGSDPGNRENGRLDVPIRSLAASQLGLTLVHTIVSGLHAGATLKYLRGTLRTERGDPLSAPSELLDVGEELEGGDAESAFDLDLGVMADAGALRLGLLVKNMTEPEFADPNGSVLMFERQVRFGLAVDAEKGGGVPLTVAVDADLRTILTTSGDRRNLAFGVEQWFGSRRVAVRGGGRFNLTGSKERTATAGASVNVRPGLFLDGYLVRGGSTDDRGWGVASRVSF